MESIVPGVFSSGLTMSSSATLLLLDNLGSNYDEKVIEWRESQVELMKSEMV